MGECARRKTPMSVGAVPRAGSPWGWGCLGTRASTPPNWDGANYSLAPQHRVAHKNKTQHMNLSFFHGLE